MDSTQQWVSLWHSELAHAPEALAYLHGRGIEDSSIDAFQLGYADLTDTFLGACAVSIPVLDYHGVVRGCTFNLLNGAQPKYYHWNMPQRGKWLFGLHLPPNVVDRPPVVVEGQYDAISLRQLGWPAYAVMGSSLSLWQAGHLAYLAQNNTVLVYPDADKPQLVQQVAKQLSRIGVKTIAPVAPYTIFAESHADPDDLSRQDPEHLLAQLANAKPVAQESPNALTSVRHSRSNHTYLGSHTAGYRPYRC
jgi:DNA primase